MTARAHVGDGDGGPYLTDNKNYIVDVYFEKGLADKKAVAEEIRSIVGVVEHGLFLGMATAVVVAGDSGVDVRTRAQ